MHAKPRQESGRDALLTHGIASGNPEVLLYGKGWRVVGAVLREAMLRLWSDDAIGLAGNVAFRTLLAIFPFLIFTSSLTAYIGDRSMADGLVTFLTQIVPQALVSPIIAEVEQVVTVQRGGVLSIGILLTVWFAIGGVDSVRIGLNRAYGIRETRSMLVLYAVQIAMVFFTSLVLALVGYLLVLAPIFGSWLHRELPEFDPASITVSYVRYPTAAAILLIALLAAHVFLPARRTKFSNIWPGVVFTAAGLIVIGVAFSFYVQHFTNYASYYAGLGGIIAALYFMYLSALVLIFGGELNRALRIRRLGRAARESESVVVE